MHSCKLMDATPGMVLARPIHNADGAVLCPVGFTLTAAALERLKNTDVDTITVEGGEDTGPTPQERIAELEKRFKDIDDPIMLQLKALVENHLNLLRLEREGAERR